MANQVRWNKYIYERFVEEAMLSQIEQDILKTRIQKIPISVQASMFNTSESTVSRIIAQLKEKYDDVQRLYPDDFPVRVVSEEEKWMDSN